MFIFCSHCGSQKIRAIDNEPLHHPTTKEVKDGIARIDRGITIMVHCDDCNKDSKLEGEIIFPIN